MMKHNYRVTFADGTFYDQESELGLAEYIAAMESLARVAPWMIPNSDPKVAFNMRTVVKVGQLR